MGWEEKVRRILGVFGESLLLTIIFGAALLTLFLHLAWYDEGRAVLEERAGASVERLVNLTSTLAITMLTLVLAILTYRYVNATRELVASNRALERIASAQESRTRPVFRILNVEGVPRGVDGNAYFHFDVINEGWKDCGMRQCIVRLDGVEGEPLQLVKRNRQLPTLLPEGAVHRPLQWIPEDDFVVRAGDRRRFSGRARINVSSESPAAATVSVEGVLPTSDSAAVTWRDKQRSGPPGGGS